MGEKGNASDLGEEILLSLAGHAAQFVSDYQQYEESRAKRSEETEAKQAQASTDAQPDGAPSAPGPVGQPSSD